MLTATRQDEIPWAAAGRRGPRRHHADATAGHRDASGRLAVAVADGVGDSSAAAFAATLAADHAVRVAVLEGDPVTAVDAAGEVLRSAGDFVSGDAALVVALAPGPDDPPFWTVAWVGDCRALAWDGIRLSTMTRDHTVAEAMRAGGITPGASLEHVLTTSVRTAHRTGIGVVRVPTPRSLVLVSDGVHRAVPYAAMLQLLDACRDRASVTDRAEWLVAAATEDGTQDNASALVVDTGTDVPLSLPTQRMA